MHQLEIPEHAINTFERIHGLNVTVHDLSGSLTPFLHPNRFYHRSPLCLTIKALGHSNACWNFELKRLRQDLADLPEGRIHVCHAGLAEWVVPVFEKEKLAWIFFAGPRLPSARLASAVVMQRTFRTKSPWARNVELPRPVKEEDAQLILEHLRQLAARLRKWKDELKSQPDTELFDPAFSNSVALRETVIRRFIEENYGEPVTLAMLAKKLSLSESRASHVVQQSCGTSFRELLVQRRLRAATELLRHSGLSVLEVALACGFEDVTHFHRLFRRRIGTTPAQYRIAGHS